jgi:hypothetical protein
MFAKGTGDGRGAVAPPSSLLADFATGVQARSSVGASRRFASLRSKFCALYYNIVCLLCGYLTAPPCSAAHDLVQEFQAAMQQLSAQTAALSTEIASLTNRIAMTERDLLDPWDGINTSQVSSRFRKSFAKKVVTYYFGDKNAAATCMVTGEAASEERLVVCAHIWPYFSLGKGLEKLGLSRDDVHCASNGLMLLNVVEEAFDAKRVAFQYCGHDDTFLFRVIDPKLLEGTVYGSVKFSAFEGEPLRLPEAAHGRVVDGRAVFPFRRLLAWHFSHALQKALDLKWRQEEALQPYFQTCSDDKVNAWLQGKSPGAKWPGQRAAGIDAMRATQAGSTGEE